MTANENFISELRKERSPMKQKIDQMEVDLAYKIDELTSAYLHLVEYQKKEETLETQRKEEE